MNCDAAREAILASLEESLIAERTREVESHIASCPDCLEFRSLHLQLDGRLAAHSPQLSLTSAFRPAVSARIRRESTWSWPDFLPDIAHLAGCGIGFIVLVVLIPQYARIVIPASVAFTAVTYLIQSMLRDEPL